MSIEATPSTKWITKSDFRAWLTESAARQTTRGPWFGMQRRSACGCPISLYLTHKHGGFWNVQRTYAYQYATFNDAATRNSGAAIAEFSLPKWANAFIQRVDEGLYTKQLFIIKPSEALAELQ